MFNYNYLFNDKPPTIYSILNSVVNYGKDDKTKIKNLALKGRQTFFDFDYPLSSKVKKEDFEVMILNKFLMRRIGYETVTAFKIALSVKLNEIMPNYNKMFDMLDGWDLFNDGEEVTHTLKENNKGNTSNEQTIENNENRTGKNIGNVTDVTSTDTRYSELPQNQISEVADGSYITDYTIQKNNNTQNSTTNTEDDINSVSNLNNEINTENDKIIEENTKRTPADKLKIYNDFIENKNNIYTMIFNDLACLFYGII